jgi:hypothetical protein
MPDPMMTTSARSGRSGVVRWCTSGFGCVVCQNDRVGFGTGSVGRASEVEVEAEAEADEEEEDCVLGDMLGQGERGRSDMCVAH